MLNRRHFLSSIFLGAGVTACAAIMPKQRAPRTVRFAMVGDDRSVHYGDGEKNVYTKTCRFSFNRDEGRCGWNADTCTGDDKTCLTCRSMFDNQASFAGFPRGS